MAVPATPDRGEYDRPIRAQDLQKQQQYAISTRMKLRRAVEEKVKQLLPELSGRRNDGKGLARFVLKLEDMLKGDATVRDAFSLDDASGGLTMSQVLHIVAESRIKPGSAVQLAMRPFMSTLAAFETRFPKFKAFKGFLLSECCIQ